MATRFDRQTQFLSRWSTRLPDRTRAVVSASKGLSEETERIAATPKQPKPPPPQPQTSAASEAQIAAAIAREKARADQAEHAYAALQAQLDQAEAKLHEAEGRALAAEQAVLEVQRASEEMQRSMQEQLEIASRVASEGLRAAASHVEEASEHAAALMPPEMEEEPLPLPPPAAPEEEPPPPPPAAAAPTGFVPPNLDLEDGEGEGGMGLVMSWEGAELASPEDDRKQLAAALTGAAALPDASLPLTETSRRPSQVNISYTGDADRPARVELAPTIIDSISRTAAAVPASENGAYLFVTVTLKPDHDMASKMPPTADEFVEALKGGAQPCFVGADDEGITCTAAQQALLGPLCAAYNAAGTAQARFELINKYMLDAVTAEIEAGVQTFDGVGYLVTLYEMKPAPRRGGWWRGRWVGPSKGTVYYLEDYPNGPAAHGRTLAVGVFRWARFVAKLVDAKIERFKTAQERDAAMPA